jgi:hypothetical protein
MASLLAFEGAAETTPSAAPRRAFDWKLALVLTAMTLLAAAAAGPRIGATRPPAFFVVIDDSPSMSARTCDAATRASTLLRDAAPDAERVDRPLAKSGAADGLPESLAPFLDDARRQGFPGVVLVTDAAITAMPGVEIVGPSGAAKTNVAVASASLDGNEAIVVARNYGARDVAVQLRCADVTRDVVVPARGVATARFVAPDRGEEATFEIASPADDLEADDRLVVARRGGARRVRLDASPKCPHLESALRAAGVEIVFGDGSADAVVDYRGGSPGAAGTPRLVVAPTADAGEVRVVKAKNYAARGDAVVGRGAFVDVLPAPGATLVAESRLTGGDALWSDAEGALATSTKDAVVLAVDPEDPRSDWHRDPSFPVLVAAALDHLAGGPDRLAPTYAVPPSESDVVHEPPRTFSADEVRAVLRPGGAVPDAVRPARWLALAAGALLAASLFVRGR